MIPFHRLMLWSVISVSALAGGCWLANTMVYGFPANDYLAPNILFCSAALALMHTGNKILFDAQSRWVALTHLLIAFYAVTVLISFTTYAIQLTPHSPIDTYLIRLENGFNIHLLPWMDWLQSYPRLKWIMELSYASLTRQLLLIPIFMIVTNHPLKNDNAQRLYIFYFLLLWTVFVGFAFYYFFPTTAPASNMDGPWFMQVQYDTGIKFNQIRHYQAPTTLEGGLISFPSYHCIWALLLVYLAWHRPLLRLLLVPLNFMLILSCFLLGWHYFVDIVGAVLLLLLSMWLFYPVLYCARSKSEDCDRAHQPERSGGLI